MKQLLVGAVALGLYILYCLGVRHNLPAYGLSQPAPSNVKTEGNATSPKQYRDGIYTGPVRDAFYGLVQVMAKVSGGQLVDTIFLQYPTDHRDSIAINQAAMPLLKQEAVT